MYHYHRVDVKALEANQSLTITPENCKGNAVKYIAPFIKGHSIDVQSYGKIRIAGLYPGIDIVFCSNIKEVGFKYDLVVHQGGELSFQRK